MCKVLIIEDDYTSAMVVKDTLKILRDADVDVALNVNEAKELLKHKKFGLLVVDVNLKDNINGFAMVSYARSLFDQAVPVIYYTAYPRGIYDGDDIFIQKPNMDELLKSYDKLINEDGRGIESTEKDTNRDSA